MSRPTPQNTQTPNKGNQSMNYPVTPGRQTYTGAIPPSPMFGFQQQQQEQSQRAIALRSNQSQESSSIVFGGRPFQTSQELVTELFSERVEHQERVSLIGQQFQYWYNAGEDYAGKVASIVDAFEAHPGWAAVKKDIPVQILNKLKPILNVGRSAAQRTVKNTEKCRDYIGPRWYGVYFERYSGSATFTDALWQYVRASYDWKYRWFEAHERIARAHAGRLLYAGKGWSANPELAPHDITRARDGSKSKEELGPIPNESQMVSIRQRVGDTNNTIIFQDCHGFLHANGIADLGFTKGAKPLPMPDGTQNISKKPGKGDLNPAGDAGKADSETPSRIQPSRGATKDLKGQYDDGSSFKPQRKRPAGNQPDTQRKVPKYVMQDAARNLLDDLKQLPLDNKVKEVANQYLQSKSPGSTGGSPTPVTVGLKQHFINTVIPNPTALDMAIGKWIDSMIKHLIDSQQPVWSLINSQEFRAASSQEFDESIRRFEKVVFVARETGGQLKPLPEEGVFQYTALFLILRSLELSVHRTDAPWILELRIQIAKVFASAAVPADFSIEVATDVEGEGIRMRYTFLDIDVLAYDGARYHNGWLGSNLVREMIRYYTRETRDAQTIDPDDLFDFSVGKQITCPRFRQGAQIIYVPVCTHGHWILVIIQLRQKSIEAYNSLPGFITENMNAQINALLAANGYQMSDFSGPVMRDCPRQSNTADCGFWTIENAYWYNRNGRAQQRNSESLRLNLTKTIVDIILQYSAVHKSPNPAPPNPISPSSSELTELSPSVFNAMEPNDPFKDTPQKQPQNQKAMHSYNLKTPQQTQSGRPGVYELGDSPTPVPIRPPRPISTSKPSKSADPQKPEPPPSRYGLRDREKAQRKFY